MVSVLLLPAELWVPPQPRPQVPREGATLTLLAGETSAGLAGAGASTAAGATCQEGKGQL